MSTSTPVSVTITTGYNGSYCTYVTFRLMTFPLIIILSLFAGLTPSSTTRQNDGRPTTTDFP